jgi:UDP-glucose 4-epimerase
MSKRIVVTGSAGFIGSHLTDTLLENGHTVSGIDNLVNGKMENIAEASKNPRFTFHRADILDREKMNALTKDADVIYHLACLGVRHSLHSPFENHRVNAEGSLSVLEAARQNNVKKFYYISTSEIYGDVTTFPIDEQAAPLPKTVYGSSKLAGENYAYSYHTCYNMDTTILRIFNNYGPRAHYEGDAGEVIPRSIISILNNKNPVVFGDGSVTRDFFYVKDTADVLAGLMEKKGLTGEIINIGTGEEITMKDLLNKLIVLMKKQDKVKIDHLPGRPADVPRLWVNNKKFKALTGFKGGIPFEEGLQKTIAFYTGLAKKKNLMDEIVIENWKK